MAARRLNPNLVKIHFCYTIEEVARFLGVHRNTVRHWIRHGLPVIEGPRPILIQGGDLKSFLVAQRTKARRPCPPGTLFCLRCRVPRKPALGMVEYLPATETAGNLTALCEACAGVMFRRSRMDAVAAVMPGITVSVRLQEGDIEERPCPPSHCDQKAEADSCATYIATRPQPPAVSNTKRPRP